NRGTSGAIIKRTSVAGASTRSRPRGVPLGRSRIAWHVVSLNTLHESRSKEVRHLAHARRNETTFRPDEAYVSDIADEFVENGDHVRVSELIGKRDLGKKANPDTGQHTSSDRFE